MADPHRQLIMSKSAIEKSDAMAKGQKMPASDWLDRMLQDDESIVMRLRPSRWFILLESVPLLILLVVLGLVLNTAVWLMEFMGLAAIMESAAIWLAAGWVAVLTVAWQYLQWRFRRYILTSHRVITAAGVVRRSIYETSLEHVRQTLISVSVMERCTGIGSLLMATAGTAVYDTAWFMIADPVGAQQAVQEQIRRIR